MEIQSILVVPIIFSIANAGHYSRQGSVIEY